MDELSWAFSEALRENGCIDCRVWDTEIPPRVGRVYDEAVAVLSNEQRFYRLYLENLFEAHPVFSGEDLDRSSSVCFLKRGYTSVGMNSPTHTRDRVTRL